MAHYSMQGVQALRLEDGRSIAPGSGEFEADISPSQEAIYLKSGALVKVKQSAAADIKAADDKPVVHIRTRRKE
jgi:hypothetical protein